MALSKKLIGFCRSLKKYTPVWVDPVMDGEQDYIRDWGMNYSGDPAEVFGTDKFTIEQDNRESQLAYKNTSDIYLPMGSCYGKVNLAGYWCDYLYTQMGTNYDVFIDIPKDVLN